MRAHVPGERELVWLGHPECHDPTLVGGKAARLSRLAAAFPVPLGFCLTTRAFAADPATGALSRHAAGLPGNLLDKLTIAYRLLAERCQADDPPVAVRSSAVDEDGHSASYAGQYQTLLHITGIEAILRAVVQCQIAALSTSVQSYREQRQLTGDLAQPAVLVQHLIEADVSVVVFSAHPVTGNRDEVLINASWGLGESVVGGTVTPDTFTVRKSDIAVIERHIARKERMTVLVAGGTREVGVPRVLQGRPALEDHQVDEVARLGIALERRMGWPVDAECAYTGARLHLLQCRPITVISAR
jgi:pyruvate,water dikinase